MIWVLIFTNAWLIMTYIGFLQQKRECDKYKAALEWIVNNSVTVEHCYSKAREALEGK